MIQRYRWPILPAGSGPKEDANGDVCFYADHLADMEAEKKKWKCYNCGFETSDKTQAEAHFSGEEGEVALCVEWANMDSSERVRAYQELTIELNETREENITLEAKVKEYLTEINNDRYTIESLIIENSTLKQQIATLKSPRCNNDIGDGTICNAELVDGGEGFGVFCPLCELRDTMQEQREQIAALTAKNERLHFILEEIRYSTDSDWQSQRAKEAQEK